MTKKVPRSGHVIMYSLNIIVCVRDICISLCGGLRFLGPVCDKNKETNRGGWYLGAAQKSNDQYKGGNHSPKDKPM